jgi:hypothetical protein
MPVGADIPPKEARRPTRPDNARILPEMPVFRMEIQVRKRRIFIHFFDPHTGFAKANI